MIQTASTSVLRVQAQLALWLFCLVTALPAQTVELTLQDGRSLDGVVDERSNRQQLWVRFSEPAMTMRMSVDWSEIVHAKLDGDSLDVATLREQVSQFATAVVEDRTDVSDELGAAKNETLQQHPQRTQRPLRSLAVHAELGNFDHDMAVDGWLLHVYPLDDHRKPIPVRGTLSVRLLRQQVRGIVRTPELIELGRWSFPVQASDLGPRGVPCQIPFRPLDPEREWQQFERGLPWLDGLPLGQLDVRLDVPGEGSFHTTLPVYLQAPSPLRDQLQLFQRARILPFERVYRGAVN